MSFRSAFHTGLIISALAFLIPGNVSARVDGEITQISLERTVCFGTCPVYKVTIHADGAVEFHGERFVALIGDFESSVNADQFEKLEAAVEQINFVDLEDEYRFHIGPDNSRATVSDLPSRIVTVNWENMTKSVLNYFGGPDELEVLESLIDEVTTVSQWTDE